MVMEKQKNEVLIMGIPAEGKNSPKKKKTVARPAPLVRGAQAVGDVWDDVIDGAKSSKEQRRKNLEAWREQRKKGKLDNSSSWWKPGARTAPPPGTTPPRGNGARGRVEDFQRRYEAAVAEAEKARAEGREGDIASGFKTN